MDGMDSEDLLHRIKELAYALYVLGEVNAALDCNAPTVSAYVAMEFGIVLEELAGSLAKALERECGKTPAPEKEPAAD